MVKQAYTPLQLAQRFIDQREIQNVMGKYAMMTMICKQADITGKLWAQKADKPTLARNNGWYVAQGEVTIGTDDDPQRVTVTGDVHLILTDGCTLTAGHNSGSITCTNTLKNDRWLNGFSDVIANIFGIRH